jgi:hypothetical protein
VTDAVTEPLSTIADEAPTKWMQRPAVMAGASAGLGAVVAAIVVLVWSFSSGPQSVQEQSAPESAKAPVPAQPIALPTTEAPAPADALPGGLPAGIPGLTDQAQGQGGLPAGVPAGLLQQGAATGSPLAAFTPRPSVISGGGGSSAALPALPQLPAAPDLQTVLDTVTPYVLPALGPSIVSGDAIAGLVGNVGGWATAAVVATANNTTTLLGNLIMASAYAGRSPLDTLVQASQGVASLTSLPGLPTPGQAFNLSGLEALSKLPAPQIGLPQLPPPPPIGLPQFPIGMPQIGLPQPPPIGLPQIGLPQPPPIGLPPPPPPLFLALFGL